MFNQIQTIWLDPEDKSWKNIRFVLVSEKVYSAAAAGVAAVSAVALKEIQRLKNLFRGWE